MHRSRLPILALGAVFAIASAASAASPIDAPSADKFCNKLCIIGSHCVPTPNGGVCVPGDGVAVAGATDAASAADQSAPASVTVEAADSIDATGSVEATDTAATPNSVPDDCLVAANEGDGVMSSASAHCPPCTILCPVGTHVVQNGKCECKCVGNAG